MSPDTLSRSQRTGRALLFNAFALLSLIVLAILPIGFVGRFTVTLIHRTRPGANRIVSVELDRGRVASWWYTTPIVAGSSTTAPAAGGFPPANPAATVRWKGNFEWPGGRDWRRALWEFDAHHLPGVTFGGQRLLLLACPIWCVAVPLMALPAIWWKRRRQRLKERHVPGFTVLECARHETVSRPAELQS